MSEQSNAAHQHEPTLVGMKTALNLVFPDSSARPSFRSWSDWKSKGYYPFVKIGRRVFVDPAKAKAALEARFTINVS